MERENPKKVKTIGYTQYVNPYTGELEDFQVISIENHDFNFHKIWLNHVINSLDLIGNQKTRLAFWIIDNLDRENKLTMTYRQISENSGISLDTVRITMKFLLESNFLERINQGAYRVNPNVIFKGTRSNRLNVLYQYRQEQNQQNQRRKHSKKKPIEDD